jgi:hypothetical protein
METAQIVAQRLLAEHARGRSWRVIKKDYRGKFSHTVLQRIATSNGAWFPKDETIIKSLTSPIIKPRKSHIPKYGWMMDYPKSHLRELFERRELMR